VPFGGIGGMIMRFRGKGRNARNKRFCNACDGFLNAFPGGAEVEMSVLFVDVRNSVVTAQNSTPQEVSTRINRFLDQATDIITKHSGFVMAFYGDCVVACWPPGFVGQNHQEQAGRAAQALIRAFAKSDIPVGVGVHSGPVFVGTVQAAKGLFRDVSLFGHTVNVTARLASNAAAGEALTSREFAEAAGHPLHNLRELTLKGVENPIEAIAFHLTE
jgi:adenylate cyclase